MRKSIVAFVPVVLALSVAARADELFPDITVAKDGTGNFKTVQEALASIPRTNTQRLVVLVKNGVYNERLTLNAPYVTLRGESRQNTRIEFNPAAAGGRGGGTVFSLEGSDFILQNITLLNTGGDPEPHAVTISSRTADHVVFIDSDVLSEGADTVSLWRNDGRYYHARCNFRGAVDSVCPHGSCYITDSTFFETRRTAVIWQDGKGSPGMKYVLRNCKFDGFDGYHLARHHHDALFFLIDCSFTKGMIDMAPYRVMYPLDGGTPTAADIANNKQHDPTNLWGERNYFYNCHRDGGDFAWFKNNLTAFSPALKSEQINASWTFDNQWDPESRIGPIIKSIAWRDKQIAITFSENMTVKGNPQLTLTHGGSCAYAAGSGTDTLLFTCPAEATAKAVDLSGGRLFASQASAVIRDAQLQLPR